MFVGQLGEGQWRYPFVFTVSEMKFPGVSAEKSVDLDLGQLESLPTVFAEEFRHWGQPTEVSTGGESTCEREDSPALPKPALNGREYRFLAAVAESPMQPCSSYAKPLQIAQKTAKHLRCRLVGTGYLREHTVQTKGRGRTSILLEITAAGKDAIAKYEVQRGSDA